MLVLAAVSDLQYQRLRGAVAPRFMLARAPTWDVALETIRGRPVEIAVVDPALSGVPSRQEIERLHLLFPSLRLILYTSTAPQSMTPQLAAQSPSPYSDLVLSRIRAELSAEEAEEWDRCVNTGQAAGTFAEGGYEFAQRGVEDIG